MTKLHREENAAMKAWKIEHDTINAAKPVLPEDTSENWLKYEEAGNAYDKKLYNDWKNYVPGSIAPCQLILATIQATENRGYNVSAAEELLPDALAAYDAKDMKTLNVLTARIYTELRRAPKNAGHRAWSFNQYSSFEDVLTEVDFGAAGNYSPEAADYESRVCAGWMAQIAGASVGTQMEGYCTPKIIEAYGDITGYLREPETYNDDLTYEIAFLEVFGENGYDVTSEDIALGWAALIPNGYSAEEIALDNIRRGIMPPESGTQGNFFCEWIGAQMRTAVHGLVAPGNPALAAELAWRDSVVSHANNGALGGVFNAVLTSLAFVEADVRVLLEKAVAMIPAKSEYYHIVSAALAECKKRENWLDTWAVLEEENKRYHWIHAYPNATAEVVALYYGNGDFDKTLNIVCQAGRDTDCNAGMIMTVLGVMAKTVAEKWSEPLHGTIKTYMRDYKEFSFDSLVAWTVESAQRAYRLKEGK